jgi:transposase-like protein
MAVPAHHSVIRYGYVMASTNETAPMGDWAKSGIVVSLGGLVSLIGDTLIWEFDPYRVKWKSPPETLLDQFTELWRKRSRAILTFAEKWGPLRIDESGHDSLSDERTRSGSEPIEWWRYLSRRAYAIRRLAKSLDAGYSGDDADWDMLTARLGLAKYARWAHSEVVRHTSTCSNARDYDKLVIAFEVSNWLRNFDVRLGLAWNATSAGWQIETVYGGRMLSAVAMQLALDVACGERMFTCSGCGKPYIRPVGRRRPNAGQSNFCSTCGRNRAPQREAEKRYRENRREALKLAAAGASVRDIADRLNRTTSIVGGWLKKNR